MADRLAYLLTGPSAAGKTTVGRLLADRFERAAFVEGDIFRRWLVRGREEMSPQPSSEALAQLRLRYSLAGATADAYFDAGFSVVVEDVIAGPMLGEYVELLRSRPLHVVVLLPSIEAVASRDAFRDTTGYEDFPLGDLYRGFAVETPRVGLWLDTSKQTPEETVDRILENAEASRV